MSTSTNVRRAAIAALFATVSGLALAQQAGNVSSEGALFGRELLDAAQAPTYDATGGREGTGTFNLGGTQVDASEMAAGVTNADIQALASDKPDLKALEQRGIDRFNEAATQEGAQGDAARVMAAGNVMSVDELTGLPNSKYGDAARQFLVQDPVAEAFKDCKSTTTPVDGQIVTGQTRDYTCATGSAGTVMSRVRTLMVTRADGGPDACAVAGTCNPSQYELEDQIAFNGQGETEALGASCRVEWACTDSSPRTIEGVLIDESVATARGLQPLFDGGAPMCWVATARTSCPVCVEDENGGQTSCTMVDISQPEETSCSTLAADRNCRATGAGCLLYGEDGTCAVESQRYTCSNPVVVPTQGVVSTNSCDAIAACSDGSCHSGMEKQGMSMQVAMAKLVVADTVATDMTNNLQTQREASTPRAGEIRQTGTTDANDPAAQWGYQQTAVEEGSTSDRQLTPEQERQMAGAQLFRGTSYSCQKSYGGLVDCCKATDGGAMKLFWDLHAQINRNNQAARLQAEGGTSGYRTMQQGGASVSTLRTPFTSMADNVSGGGSAEYSATTLTVWQQFMAKARAEIKPALSPKWACSDVEFDLAVQREVSMCSFAGTYCSKSVLGTCLKRREAYCCYKSPMSKMLRASVEPGGQLRHGSPKQPDCSGVPLDQVGKIDWSVMDFNQLAGNMQQGGVFTKAGSAQDAERNYTGAGATGASADRKTVSVRTTERLASIDTEAVYSTIAADAAGMNPYDAGEVQATPATLSFAATYRSARAGQPTAIGLERVGSRGTAAVEVRVREGAAIAGDFRTQTVRWAAGDVASKNVPLTPAAGAAGRIILELVAVDGAVGGNRLITIDVQ